MKCSLIFSQLLMSYQLTKHVSGVTVAMPGTDQFQFSDAVDKFSHLLSKLDGRKASGLNNISPKLLKIDHVYLAKPLANEFEFIYWHSSSCCSLSLEN